MAEKRLAGRQCRLMDWVLQQKSPRKEALLQAFSGASLAECAHRSSFSLSEIEAAVRWAAYEGPTFAEDDYVMSYYATKNKEDFYRATGQGEGVYLLLSLRYPKCEVGKGAEENSASPRARSAGVARKAASRRRAAHVPDENKGSLAEAFDAACERLSSSPRPVASADFKKEFASELAMRDISTDEMPNDAALRRMLERDERVIWAGADSFWFFDWRTHGRSVREAVECIAFTDTEYSVRFLYRKTHKLMRQLGIRAPDELYEILRRIYLGFGKKVTFGSDLSFGFGKIDRQRQIQRFVAEHPDEPKSELAMGYEREYGFSAGLAEMWIDSFAQVESVSLSEWVEKATAEAKPKNSTPKELTSSIEAFLERELTGDVCDAELVRQRFSYEFPGKGDVTRNGKMLAKAGYYADKGLLFKVGSAPNEHFTRLISSRSAFAKGDSDFEEVVWKHAAFRYVLQGMLREHRVLLYEEGSCISFLRIHDVLGMRMADVEAYAPAACSFVLEGKPFTVHNLRKDLGFSHVLDSFEMPDAFYESLIGVSDLAQSCVLAGVKVFVVSDEGRFNASAFLERIVAENEGIPREDMPRLLQQEYGIGCPMPTLVTAIYNSSVYHDDVGDAYYSSMEAWKQEVRNELAS